MIGATLPTCTGDLNGSQLTDIGVIAPLFTTYVFKIDFDCLQINTLSKRWLATSTSQPASMGVLFQSIASCPTMHISWLRD